MKIKALHNWDGCWKAGDVFEVYTDEKGFAYIRCNFDENGPHHIIDNDGGPELTPSDIRQGKSTQFICLED